MSTDFLYRDDDPTNPTHYRHDGGEECIDMLRRVLGDLQFAGFCEGNWRKYVHRAGHKGALEEDLGKAAWYYQMQMHVWSGDGSWPDPRAGVVDSARDYIRNRHASREPQPDLGAKCPSPFQVNTSAVIDLAMFSRTPGGRYRSDGKSSGQEFREDVLLPALDVYDEVVVDLDHVVGLPSSFAEEAFGGVVRALGAEACERVQVTAKMHSRSFMVRRFMRRAAADCLPIRPLESTLELAESALVNELYLCVTRHFEGHEFAGHTLDNGHHAAQAVCAAASERLRKTWSQPGAEPAADVATELKKTRALRARHEQLASKWRVNERALKAKLDADLNTFAPEWD